MKKNYFIYYNKHRVDLFFQPGITMILGKMSILIYYGIDLIFLLVNIFTMSVAAKKTVIR